MTRKEAINLYRSGEEATVEKLLELDVKVQELTKASKLTHDLSTPSGMKPSYDKVPAKKRKKLPGRKKGHKGSRRPLPKEIHNTKEHSINTCPQCNTTLNKPISTRERFTEDIPISKPIITKHVIDIYYCPKCKKNVEAPVEDALPKSTLGLQLIIHTAYLHFFLGLPLHKIVAYLNSCLYFKVSPGGLSLAWHRLAQILLPWHQEIKMLVKNSPMLHIDETGWRVRGKSYWLWAFACKKTNSVCYVISPSRASPVIKKLLGNLFKGIIICDFFGAYNKITAFLKQRCLVHLLRDIKRTSVSNKSTEWKMFAKKLKRLIKDAIRLGVNSKTISPSIYNNRRNRIYDRLKEFICKPYNDKDCKRLIKRLKRHQNELFTFLNYKNVPFDNNHAERIIRPVVIARKNSYANRSDKGAETQAILMSLFQTLHLRNCDQIDYLNYALKLYCKSGQLPRLENTSDYKLKKVA